MLFSEVVAASAAVRATRSRKAKIAALAELFASAGPTEIATVVAWLSGELTQGRIGAGWRTVTGLDTPPSAEASLTVEAVDAVFTQLTGLSGTGSALRRRELLTELFTAATADEQSFLLRLLTGELRQGALTAIVVEALAQATGIPIEVVRRAHMLSGQLPATAVVAITGGEAALRAFRLEVGRPVAPMLASPGGSLDEALAELGPRVSVEHKLDGARIQVHRQGEQVWIFTRTLRDITAGVPELVELVRGLACTSVVLDGETLALTDAGRPRPFQETMSRFATVADTTELLLHPYFFDCLHLDGRDLLDEPLQARRTALELVAGEHAIPALVAPDAEAAADYYDDALAVGNEGVMIKSLDAPYAAGRRGKSWQKIKPAHTLDLLVIGAEWGYGRRTGFLSNLHLAARDEETGEPVMVGKTFKGLTDELLRWQTAEFPRYQSGTDGHAVFLRPELVVEIALDGVQTSTRYPGGVALRFARVVRYRPDKEPQQADTIATVRALG
ncbi:DNA ligase [Nocardia neocaledoniensis NBRC 108232]|uniref:Probable DNA ligase n=1 Tax=Nocardia neocaledoniensis TaxID=236511 RepID=A0A317NFJ7_9NOCA|nr:ATP-dependent DNA ligase [Nocardia neocaledoniensis]PWV73527.1 DNA ligase-1 [Nocardia neocaledoniensis]GEM29952.1 DNA ligase [Nocardia neocaledoniensis NBRC 108232]